MKPMAIQLVWLIFMSLAPDKAAAQSVLTNVFIFGVEMEFHIYITQTPKFSWHTPGYYTN